MRTIFKIATLVVLSCLMLSNSDVFAQRNREPVRVLLVTGGQGFNRDLFHAFLGSLPGITFTEARHPEALQMFRPENRSKFDVVLLFDMPREIGEQEKKDFTDMLNEGKGMLVLHHAFCSYQNWPEYQNIIGGRYHQEPWTDSDGVARPASNYTYNVNFRVRVTDRRHPVTRGVRDFNIIDEAYGNGVVNPGVHVLLATDAPESTPSIGWTNRYGKSNIVTILLGHDNQSWTNPNFAKIVEQAIKWVR